MDEGAGGRIWGVGILSENLGAQFEYSNLNPSSEASCAALSKPHCLLSIHYKNLSIIKKLKHGQIGKDTKITLAPSTSEPVTSVSVCLLSVQSLEHARFALEHRATAPHLLHLNRHST